MVSPSPFVYWAQDANNIFIKVDLKDIQEPKVEFSKNYVAMTANGVGAHGLADYSFSLNLFGDLDSDDEVHQTKMSPRAVEFVLKKATSSWWPRLIKHQQKPAWLKVDFERWKSEDDDLSDTNMENSGAKDIMGDYPELFEKLKRDEFGYVKEDVRKVYLAFYNLTQFVFFTYILVVMGVRFMRDGQDSLPGTYEAVGVAIKFAQLLQFLEIFHSLIGYTKGSPLFPLLQVCGRAFILFIMIDSEPRIQAKPVVFYLFAVWSSIEIVRYPYYISDLYKRNIAILTWLRYTIWIPLYPLGSLCEGVIILRNIPYFEETQKFIISMPNIWNFTFHMPTLMRMYLLFLFFPGIYSLMTHMYRARIKKLGPKQWKAKLN